MSKKIKFSISIKELSISFEGDQDVGQDVQAGIQQTLGTLVSAHTPALGLEPQFRVLDVAPVPPKARRRRRASTSEEVTGTGASNSSDTEPRARRSRSSIGALGHTEQLVSEGYFTKARRLAEVTHALRNKGHIYLSNKVSTALLSLTKKQILVRESDADGYLYKRAK